MPIDWTNLSPARLPKSDTTTENKEVSVLPDRETVTGLKPVPIGPGKVFPRGYPTTKGIEAAESSPPSAPDKLEQRDRGTKYRYENTEYTLTPLWWKGTGRWWGFVVESDLGITWLEGVGITTEPEMLIRRHLNEKTGRTFVTREDVLQKAIKLTMSREVDLLGTHGVADPNKVYAMLIPEGQSVLHALAEQNVFLITSSFKVVDTATSPWPIDLDKARDVRSQLANPVGFKGDIGLVASRLEEDIVLVEAGNTFKASIFDLDPIMLQKDYRLAMAGGRQ